MNFLTAAWKNLILVQYEVDPQILKPYLPQGVELDLLDGKAFVSLVSLEFLNTTVLGIKIPFHQKFTEINLRCYAKHKTPDGWQRGVIFIKEIVPHPMLSLVAKYWYKERYQTLKTRTIKKDPHSFRYEFLYKKEWQKIEIKSSSKKEELSKEEQFFAERYRGYTKTDSQTYTYTVSHPKWNKYPIIDSTVDIDFESVYENKFSFLKNKKPHSVLHLDGSNIAIQHRQKLMTQ